ncbi:WASH complex subunit 2-like isoform X2 [Xenia sp. Carnegie-2017]|uniref:WASH complex subunit 2-like isoform X2 n=1 Tax=Xenia sp. Carnegie-2017 TaxID=2897299 RepID=UPI001F03CD29|nr:WASH complex subunit 2-like isoform X2 [Xenia sp. Carnegie-2017]
MASEIPTAPPPPPLLVNNSNLSVDVVGEKPSSPSSSEKKISSTNDEKSWERAWSVAEMRKGATHWSLASDAGLLLYLQEFSQNMLSQTHRMEQKVDGLVYETKGISTKVNNTFNNFLMLSNTQFIENRVYDEEETKEKEEKQSEAPGQEKEKTREELETEVIPKINEAIQYGLNVLDSAFVTVEITPEQISDDEDEGALPDNLRPEPILELNDVYANRRLPFFIGSPEFDTDDLVGLGESDDEDEVVSDEEVGEESETEKSSDDDETSESETVSVSESDEESSSTATKSEEDNEDSEDLSEESDGDLFSSSGTVPKAIVSQSSENKDNVDPVKSSKENSNKPLDFTSELAAKLAGKINKPKDTDDEHADNDWDESEEQKDIHDIKEDLVSSSSSHSTKKKKKKDKPKTDSLEKSAKSSIVSGIIEEDDDDLFTSSIDTTSTVQSKSRNSKSKHKREKKRIRSDSQVSDTSSKSLHKETKATFKNNDENLFGDPVSPEDGLFGANSPFSKKGGRYSGGVGLFDDVEEEDNDQTSFKDDTVEISPSQVDEQHETEEKIVKESNSPRTASGKKLPPGAVSIFGDHGPFGHIPIQSHEHQIEKKHVVVKQEATGGSLFSDEDEDTLTSSQSSVSPRKPAVVVKTKKSVDLFGADEEVDDEEDVGGLFGVKNADKKQSESKVPKKKIPVGAQSIFGIGSPDPMFDSSKPDVTPKSVSNLKPAKPSNGLFDDDFDDKTESYSSQRSAVSSIIPPVRSNQKINHSRLFDDNEDDEDDVDDLFTTSSKEELGSTKNSKITSKVESSANKPLKGVEARKTTSKATSISLFDDEDEDEEDSDEDGIFSPPNAHSKDNIAVPSTKKNVVETSTSEQKDDVDTGKPSRKFLPGAVPLFGGTDIFAGKKSLKTKHDDDLFGDEDDLFASKSKPVVPSNTKPVKQDNDNDLKDNFDDALPSKETPKDVIRTDEDLVSGEEKSEDNIAVLSTKKNVVETSTSEQKDDVDTGKPSRKFLPGAVPLFGGTDIFAGKKSLKTKHDDDLFGDEDDLFASKSKPVVPSNTKPVKQDNDETPKDVIRTDEDLFSGEEKSEDNIAVLSTKKNVVETTTSEQKDDVDTGKPSRKFLPGAVPLFGGTDIFAGKKSLKTKHDDDLFGDEDDLFASKSKPVVPSNTKPVKQDNNHLSRTSVLSSPLEETTATQKSLSLSSSIEKTSNVAKLQKKMTFNPATMLPGGTPPSRKPKHTAEANFDEPALMQTLESTNKERARLRGKRRPPTRQARQKAARDSMDDTLLFGSNLIDGSTSYERVPARKSGHTSHFSDSGDHFSSSSYQKPFKRNEKPNITQSRGPKFDPLFIHNSMVSDTSTFEDSVNSVDGMKQNKDNESSSSKSRDEKVTKDVFNASLKDELFDASLKNDSLSKSKNLGNQVTSAISVNQKPNNDIFSGLLNDNEEDVPLGNNNSETVSTKSIPGKSNFPRNWKSNSTRSDSLFGSQRHEDLFSNSESDVNKNALAKKNLFSQLPENKGSQKSKSSQFLQEDENVGFDPLFSGFNQTVKQDGELFVEGRKILDKSAKDNNSENTTRISITNDKMEGNVPFQSDDKEDKSSVSTSSAFAKKDDDDDEDDLFKSNKGPLSSPPPLLDFDHEISVSGDFNEKPKKSRTVKDDLFSDSYNADIFTSKSKEKIDEEKVKEHISANDDGEKIAKGKSKIEEERKMNENEDSFADNESLLDGIPKKANKKKKKTTIPNIFDDGQDVMPINNEPPTSKTNKKVKGKKKAKNKTSIFDDDSPDIFKDPLNAN